MEALYRIFLGFWFCHTCVYTMLKKNKDQFLRQRVLKNDIKLSLFKFLLYNKNLSFFERSYLCYLIKSFAVHSNRTKVVNRSIDSLKNRSILRKFRTSRWEFKQKASFGKLDNVEKASW